MDGAYEAWLRELELQRTELVFHDWMRQRRGGQAATAGESAADEAPWPAPPQRPPAAAAPSTRPFVALADLLLSQPDAQGSLDAIWRCYAASAAEQALEQRLYPDGPPDAAAFKMASACVWRLRRMLQRHGVQQLSVVQFGQWRDIARGCADTDAFVAEVRSRAFAPSSSSALASASAAPPPPPPVARVAAVAASARSQANIDELHDWRYAGQIIEHDLRRRAITPAQACGLVPVCMRAAAQPTARGGAGGRTEGHRAPSTSKPPAGCGCGCVPRTNRPMV